MFLDILKAAVDADASDVILSTGSHPSFKMKGGVHFIKDFPVVTPEEMNKTISGMMNDAQKQEFSKELELDFGINIKGLGRFRVNVFSSKGGYGAVFRPIASTVPAFEKLGLPEKLLEFAGQKSGLILVTGGVGSGKSTTLTALLEYINGNYSKHVITVEDPIEYVYTNDKCLFEQREVGTHTKNFENGLKYALRQASDVIMIGEMRDLETFKLALRAAETGNLVIATLHASGAANTVTRIIDMFPPEQKEQIQSQLSQSLLGVIWQSLIKANNERGRALCSELLVNNDGIANMIRKGMTHQIYGTMETGAADGMYTKDKSIEKLQEEGIID